MSSIALFSSINFRGNMIASFWQDLGYEAPATNVYQLIDQNTYYFYVDNCLRQPFVFAGSQTSIDQWRAKGFDLNSTIQPCGIRPSGLQVTMRRNAYDPNRTNVIINNYAKSPALWSISRLS